MTRYKYNVNLIAENIHVQMDDEVHQFQLLAEIQDHWKDGVEISKEEGNIRSSNGTERDKIMTRGWEGMVLYKYVSMDIIQLKYIKDSNPVKVVEYVVANDIQDDPEFAWLVSKVLRRRNIIISKVVQVLEEDKKVWDMISQYCW